MNLTNRQAVGVLAVFGVAPAMAQPATRATQVADCASCAAGDQLIVRTPTDPTWLVATLVIGLVIGYLVGRMSKRR